MNAVLAPLTNLGSRIATIDWSAVKSSLDDQGFAVVPALLPPLECAGLTGMYSNSRLFRSRIVMARHGFGRGEYQYFSYPLPAIIQTLRNDLYSPLATIANRWQEQLGRETSFPSQHRDFLDRCHAAGQSRPTALLLKYGEHDYNCLHQDLYGEQIFPLQTAILLSQPGVDFSGGEFVITEQRPRMQSRVSVVPLTQGDAVIFAVNERPVTGSRGFHKVKLRHGVSRITSGQRYTAGIVFHDAS